MTTINTAPVTRANRLAHAAAVAWRREVACALAEHRRPSDELRAERVHRRSVARAVEAGYLRARDAWRRAIASANAEHRRP